MIKFRWVQCFNPKSKTGKTAKKLRRMAKRLYKLYKKHGAQYAEVSVVPNGVCLTMKVNDCYIIQDFSKLPEGE